MNCYYSNHNHFFPVIGSNPRAYPTMHSFYHVYDFRDVDIGPQPQEHFLVSFLKTYHTGYKSDPFIQNIERCHHESDSCILKLGSCHKHGLFSYCIWSKL